MSAIFFYTYTTHSFFLVDQMTHVNELNKIGGLIKQAQEAETHNALQSALGFYQQALVLLAPILTSKPDKLKDPHIARVSNYSVQCLEKAEEIKEMIQGGGSVASSSSSSSSSYQDKRASPDDGGSHNEDKRRMMQEMAMTCVDPSEIGVSWDDIVGMKHIKKILDDAIHLPRELPELFTGMRTPTRSVLFYGPPGTGKTLLGKATAHSANMPFYAVSSAELISKYVGESEKYVKMLFDTVKHNKPCVLFLDELESLCPSRDKKENTQTVQQFLVQLDGISSTGSMSGVFLIGCTNTPWKLDEAMIRRLEKRIYIALPNTDEREALLKFYLKKNDYLISDEHFREIALLTENFSAADISQLAKTAAMLPLDVMRSAVAFQLLEKGTLKPCSLSHKEGIPMTYAEIADKRSIVIPPITHDLVLDALKTTKSTINVSNLKEYDMWTQKHGQ